MICSISTGKSGSNWLDRLRSSKGFPASEDVDLEHFLSHRSSNHPNSSDIKASDFITNNIDPKSNSNPTQSDDSQALNRNQTTEIPDQNGESEWFGIMDNVVSDLFNMGDSNDFPRINGKKSYRKQPNPKICVLSTSTNIDELHSDDVRREADVSPTIPSSGDNSCMEIKQKSDQMTKQENVDVGSVDVEEEEKSHSDLSAFSRTEVTVIDTSCRSWKFEKLLFRRKNMWKVRDKKCKSMSISRKKRKANPLDENVNGEKKQKHSVMRCSSAMPSNEGQPHSDKQEEACKETPDILSQIPRKRQVDWSATCGSWYILFTMFTYSPCFSSHGCFSGFLGNQKRRLICYPYKKHSF
ncbi:hypothetical protein F0562_031035 [Nyssa sinensis]|uniref:Uncharacterized protein n=1 Tax=Nyssa sinensis TaxID=561372 RepID=A0A5J5AX53_9ASTE|nr:hypothetical protein F0562_031035 [Nyssa sinensis]